MRPASLLYRSWVLAALLSLAAAAGCDLNPQPLPPGSGASQAVPDSGIPVGGSGSSSGSSGSGSSAGIPVGGSDASASNDGGAGGTGDAGTIVAAPDGGAEGGADGGVPADAASEASGSGDAGPDAPGVIDACACLGD